MQILKYALPFREDLHYEGAHTLEMSAGEIIKVTNQYDTVTFWVKANTDIINKRGFLVLRTGAKIEDIGNMKYLDTVLFASGTIVWHVFELL